MFPAAFGLADTRVFHALLRREPACAGGGPILNAYSDFCKPSGWCRSVTVTLVRGIALGSQILARVTELYATGDGLAGLSAELTFTAVGITRKGLLPLRLTLAQGVFA